MDLLDSITGRTETSRRALIRGAIIGGAGIAGVTSAQTGGDEAINYLKDDSNDDDSTGQSAELADGSGGGDGSDGSKGDGGSGSSRGKEVVSQVDLTERDGRVTVRLGAYERVVADLNPSDGDSVGNSAWRIDGARAARSGVSFRAYEGDSVRMTLQNPTPIPYSLSISTASSTSDGERLAADNRGVTVHAGDVETLVVDELVGGEYAYEIETLTRPIEPLVGRLLVDSESDSASSAQ